MVITLVNLEKSEVQNLKFAIFDIFGPFIHVHKFKESKYVRIRKFQDVNFGFLKIDQSDDHEGFGGE